MTQVEYPRAIPARDFAVLAIEEMAYVKPALVEGKALFMIHAADGTEIGVAEQRQVADVMIRRHNLTPVSVH
jgi:hypothetical protein